jgi:regulator of protease activity HflC (stomatin/prohibitin superfamily)
MTDRTLHASQERPYRTASGWLWLVIVLALFAACAATAVLAIRNAQPLWFVPMTLLSALAIGLCFGFFSLQPNEARVLVLFGDYIGTERNPGFHWANPFYSRGSGGGYTVTPDGKVARHERKHAGMKVSLRARNLNGDRLKVNDKQGNPVEIAAVVVWRVADTAQALFDVDDVTEYVRLQSESALRHLGSQYAYDHGEEYEVTLRSGLDEVAAALKAELEQRLSKAGVAVEEARLTHLAYAPEIAQAMLRRQQADAVLAARQKIVHGAVLMVDQALRDLAERQVVELDGERKAAMVSNLLVVLCGDAEAKPVINTGTLYS